MSLWQSSLHDHNYGKIHLDTPLAKNLETVDQFYKIPGTYEITDAGRFESDAAGVLTYKGSTGVFLLNGVSDVQVNKASKVAYGLYLNGSLAPGAQTPHDFTATAKIENISITEIVELKYGDTLEVYAKSDTANTLLTPATLSVTFFGSRQ